MSPPPCLIPLFTDFGPTGPYVGQLHAVLARLAPAARPIDLLCDAPAFSPPAAAHLLASLAPELSPGSVFLCVVDPGVGTERAPVVARADGRWFVGPGNGLFDVVIGRARSYDLWAIRWRPRRLSRTFHGRDLFAPVAAAIAAGTIDERGWLAAVPWEPLVAAEPLPEIVYVDHFGNAMTGLLAEHVPAGAVLTCRGTRFAPAGTFADVPAGGALWLANSSGLAELALNQGSAAATCGVRVGDPVQVASPDQPAAISGTAQRRR